MTDDVYDDDPYDPYDPYDDLPAKEEPDCGGCNDGHTVPAGWFVRLVLRRPWVRCPSCNPSRFTIWYLRLGLWRIRGWLWRLRHPRTVLTDEPPF